MAMCGYNKKIGTGLKSLFDGMIDSMEEKALKSSNIKVLDDEIRELNIMIDKMQNQGVIQDIFIGLNIFAKHFFSEIRKQIENNPNESLRSLANKLIPAFIMTIKDGEEYRNDLESVAKKTNDEDYAIKLVADWVNVNGRCDYENQIILDL
jgi:hypothetical protein